MPSATTLIAAALLAGLAAALVFAVLRWRAARRLRHARQIARLAAHVPHRFPKRRG